LKNDDTESLTVALGIYGMRESFTVRFAMRWEARVSGTNCRAALSFLYFFAAVGGTRTRGTTGHSPLPVLVPVVLPEASRRVPLAKPEEPFVVWLPADRFDASRKSVRLPLVPLGREVELPVMLLLELR
jgi:hypothetical protein